MQLGLNEALDATNTISFFWYIMAPRLCLYPKDIKGWANPSNYCLSLTLNKNGKVEYYMNSPS